MTEKSNNRTAAVAKWATAVVAVAGVLGSVVDLYREKAAIEATSLASEADLAQSIEELQDMAMELETRLRVIEVLASRRVVEFGDDPAKAARKAAKKEERKKARLERKLRKPKRAWTQQMETP